MPGGQSKVALVHAEFLSKQPPPVEANRHAS